MLFSYSYVEYFRKKSLVICPFFSSFFLFFFLFIYTDIGGMIYDEGFPLKGSAALRILRKQGRFQDEWAARRDRSVVLKKSI